MMTSTGISIVAAGDVLINRTSPELALRRLEPLLRHGDVATCNLEGVLGSHLDPLPGRGGIAIAPVENVAGLSRFDVVSLANNHSLDAGHAGLFSTLDELSRIGVRCMGAGRSQHDAWAPVVVSRGRTSVALIAASAVLRVGYEAGANKPGIAALRSTDFYASQFPGAIVPGAPPRVHTELNEDDWRRLELTVRDARERAEWVVANLHWGDHTSPFGLTQLERLVARRLAELGVDAIVGHHHHALRGIEYVGRTPVLYGLGHLVFDQPEYAARFMQEHPECAGLSDDAMEDRFGRYTHFPRQSGFLFDKTSRWTAVARIKLSNRDGARVSLVPLRINDDHVPEMLTRHSEAWREFTTFMGRCQKTAQLKARVEDCGVEIEGFPALEVLRDCP
jgi:poly-gamma-glutamate synthesis protein (capsule biosynthesis protein)